MKTLLKIIKHPWLFIKWRRIKNGELTRDVKIENAPTYKSFKDAHVGMHLSEPFANGDGFLHVRYMVIVAIEGIYEYRHVLGYKDKPMVKYTTFEEYLSIYCKPFYSQ